MGDKSKIQWTDATWNPIRANVHTEQGELNGWACQKVSPGCANCYAETMNRRRGTREPYDGKGAASIYLDEEFMLAPFRWSRPRMIFPCSMTDLFWAAVPDEWIGRVYGVMLLTPRHSYQVLTKRAGRMARYLQRQSHMLDGAAWSAVRARLQGVNVDVDVKPVEEEWKVDPHGPADWPLPNVWNGVSVENQVSMDFRAADIIDVACNSAVTFLSLEPLIGPVVVPAEVLDAVDWVIVGGESGPRARPCEVSWIKAILRQCRTAEVACFVKQLGAVPLVMGGGARDWPRTVEMVRHEQDGCAHLFRPRLVHTKGGDPDEWPERLRVREWPR